MNESKNRVVIIDDDEDLRVLLEQYLKQNQIKALAYDKASLALEELKSKKIDPDLFLIDLMMPEIDGLTLLKQLRDLTPSTPVIMMTAHGSVETAVDAMNKGAFTYVQKPLNFKELLILIEKAFQYKNLHEENQVLRQELQKSWTFAGIIGKSPGMQRVFQLVQKVAHSQANVLITGESGTGKELVAHAIHNNSDRKDKKFVAINCAAIPETLLESELFGHSKGAFTGATERRKGLFEEADGGTIFLDEIGDMPLHLQAKLLRVLQEKEIRAVGENNTRTVDVRVLAATHRNLKNSISEGKFREDLFYRLNVVPIEIPALKDRKEDIHLLGEHFLKKYAATHGVRVKGFSKNAMNKLLQFEWPGNVRELENTIERAVILASNEVIEPDDLTIESVQQTNDPVRGLLSQNLSLQDLEREYIRLVLQRTDGQKEKAANILGINRKTLYRKEREYGLVSLDI